MFEDRHGHDIMVVICLECGEAVDTETGVYIPELDGYCHEWCEEFLREEENEW